MTLGVAGVWPPDYLNCAYPGLADQRSGRMFVVLPEAHLWAARIYRDIWAPTLPRAPLT